jgi:hypothetical protein
MKINAEMLIRVWLSRHFTLIRRYLRRLTEDLITYIAEVKDSDPYLKKLKAIKSREQDGIEFIYYKDASPSSIEHFVQVGQIIILLARLKFALISGNFDEGNNVLRTMYPQKFKRIYDSVTIP